MESLFTTNGILIVACAAGVTSFAGGLWMAYAARDPEDDGDLGAMIANAPHHHLDNILPKRKTR